MPLRVASFSFVLVLPDVVEWEEDDDELLNKMVYKNQNIFSRFDE